MIEWVLVVLGLIDYILWLLGLGVFLSGWGDRNSFTFLLFGAIAWVAAIAFWEKGDQDDRWIPLLAYIASFVLSLVSIVVTF